MTAGAAHQRRLLAHLDDNALRTVELAVTHLITAAEAEQAGDQTSTA
jgi:hypothetical protein